VPDSQIKSNTFLKIRIIFIDFELVTLFDILTGIAPTAESIKPIQSKCYKLVKLGNIKLRYAGTDPPAY
jgi:hypothetical protein